MTRTLLVVPTGHGVGLTAACLGLVRALERDGVSVGFFKPLAQPGAGRGGPDRSGQLVRLVSRLEPAEPIATDVVERHLSEGAIESLMEEVIAAGEETLAATDVVVVEGLVPSAALLYSGRVNLALARALDADVVLVGDAGSAGPGRLAESMAIIAEDYRTDEHDRVVGAMVNRLADTSDERVAALCDALDRRHLPLVAAVPWSAELTWPRVSDLVAGLSLEVLTEGDQTRRITDVIVAAQAVPALLPLLRPGRLVVVPGDRHDVVLGACLAAMNGIPLAALLLTVGERPDPRVWELARGAAATGLPILVTPDYTYETATHVAALDPQVPADDVVRAQLVADSVADRLDAGWLGGLPQRRRPVRISPAAFRRRLTTLAVEGDRRIVLPEGAEPRTVRAAVTCHQRGIARCTLLAPPDDVAAVAAELGLNVAGLEVVDPRTVEDRHVAALVEARAHKGMTDADAREALLDPIVRGTIMLRLGEMDGLVAGAVHTTAATVRPALQILPPSEGAKLVSSVFFMLLPDEVVVYGDCAINPDPDAEQLADIAVQSAASAAAFGIVPRVAMISFSTGSSGAGSDVAKVAEATRLARLRAPDLAIDGPLQYDAAASMSVARSKAPGSPVAGSATVFVFPDLNTGNTTYKAVQRSADVVSIGPMLQGLAMPVNDLSRGATVEDIVYTIALTAVQATRS